MDILYEAAVKYILLENYEYHFVISQNRKLQTIQLNFIDTDFFHLAGLQYLSDIVIPQDRTQTLKQIVINHNLSTKSISKSLHYINKDSKKDVKSRIEELRFLEEYLDTDNFIKIFNLCNQKYISSSIKADYLIEYGSNLPIVKLLSIKLTKSPPLYNTPPNILLIDNTNQN